MRHVNEAMLHPFYGPRQEILERTRLPKVEVRELALKGREVESRCDRALRDALVSAMQRPRQEIIPTLAVRAWRKQGRSPSRLLGRSLQVLAAAPSA